MGGYIGIEYKRIKKVLSKDKNNMDNSIVSVLKSEICDLLSNYMNVENIECSTILQSNGKWQIQIIANTSNFYAIKTTL